MHEDIPESDDACQIGNVALKTWLNASQSGECLANDRELTFHRPTPDIIGLIIREILSGTDPGNPIGRPPSKTISLSKSLRAGSKRSVRTEQVEPAHVVPPAQGANSIQPGRVDCTGRQIDLAHRRQAAVCQRRRNSPARPIVTPPPPRATVPPPPARRRTAPPAPRRYARPAAEAAVPAPATPTA